MIWSSLEMLAKLASILFKSIIHGTNLKNNSRPGVQTATFPKSDKTEPDQGVSTAAGRFTGACEIRTPFGLDLVESGAARQFGEQLVEKVL